MKVLIITPFYNENLEVSRPAFIFNVLISNNINVDVITSDFSHIKKERVNFSSKKIETLPTIKYKKNTSIIRFISHLFLAFKLFYYAFKKRNKYDVFYVTAPFSIIVMLLKLFTSKKIIVDIVDFWPDSLPFPKGKFMPLILKPWSYVNRKAINMADAVISLSSEFLSKVDNINKEQILLGSRNRFNTQDMNKKSDKYLNLVYIGNIGKLYDFKTLIKAIVSSNLNIHIDIIGDGDYREYIIKQCIKNNISYTYHGIIYDNSILDSIMATSDFGFNGFYNTNASFSYKSISYMKYGVPIINSMGGDLWDFINKYNIGFNYEAGNILQLSEVLVNCTSSKNKSDNVKVFFNDNLDYDLVSRKIYNKFLELF
ncbi:glycosyltransferase [Photobacterium iliopiscarium]|uniref:glycosyltransferase n=1 Tax=Photobacterium iliopiscarium TaxID=56192 RepID=UPI001E36A5B9|nr:glycosyltransferase [Photobacterium iliopiscarium]